MNDQYFCFIEDEEKAFSIVKKYYKHIQYIKQGDEARILNKIDSEIQIEEISKHVYLNGCEDENDDERLNWIHKNGHSFRVYLNTLKLACLVLKAADKNPEHLSFEDFKKIKNQINMHHYLLNISY